MQITDEERLARAVKSVRTYLRDKKEINRLLGGEFESSDDEVKQALFNALMDWNNTPPLIQGVNLTTHPNKMLLVMKAGIECIQSARIWHSREHMPSSDGGTSADDHAKAAEYDGILDRLTQEYERKKGDLKTALNIAAAFGNMGMPSEYSSQYYIFGQMW